MKIKTFHTVVPITTGDNKWRIDSVMRAHRHTYNDENVFYSDNGSVFRERGRDEMETNVEVSFIFNVTGSTPFLYLLLPAFLSCVCAWRCYRLGLVSFFVVLAATFGSTKWSQQKTVATNWHCTHRGAKQSIINVECDFFASKPHT